MVTDILEQLKGGDRRSIGRANEVVTEVLDKPELFEILIAGMTHEDPVVRMRAADAVEKISAHEPQFLEGHEADLIEIGGQTKQQELRWHFAQISPRLSLDENEQKQVVEILRAYLTDESKIVQVSALQALADLVEKDVALLDEVYKVVERQTITGSPAVKSRSKKIKPFSQLF